MIPQSRVILGPAYGSLGSTNFRVKGDIKIEPTFETIPFEDALLGTVDEIVKNRFIKMTCKPIYYDASVTTALFWPWISIAAAPPGTAIVATTDATATATGANGDTFELMSAAVTKMPDLFLGVEEDFYASDMEITGVPVSGDDPSTNNSLFTVSTGNSFSAPAIPSSSKRGRQKYTAVWGSFSGFTSFQGFKGFKISSELNLNPVYDNGQIIDWTIKSIRWMAEVIASANTMAQMLTAMAFQNTGAAQGQGLSAQSGSLAISGASNVTVTLGAAAIKTGSFVFGNEQLRQGPIRFVSTNLGLTTAALTLA